MVYDRPTSVRYPTVWRRFSVRRGSSTVHLRVQDLTEQFLTPTLQLMETYFVRDEPTNSSLGLVNQPAGVAELTKTWRILVKDRVSLICVVDNEDPYVVGANILTVLHRGDEKPSQTKDRVWATIYGAVELVAHGVDIFTKYNVDQYISGFGMVVDPQWRGCNIGKELLEARLPLCKALGIKVTATVFTAAASQAVAKKAGFQEIFEITYEELAKRGFVFPGVEKNNKSSKLMVLVAA